MMFEINWISFMYFYEDYRLVNSFHSKYCSFQLLKHYGFAGMQSALGGSCSQGYRVTHHLSIIQVPH